MALKLKENLTFTTQNLINYSINNNPLKINAQLKDDSSIIGEVIGESVYSILKDKSLSNDK